MSLMNRLNTSQNEFQGEYPKVLCVCAAGVLRSPTAALVLSQPPFNFNTRAAGIEPNFALIKVDEVLLHWADEIVVMEQYMADELAKRTDKPIVCLNIEDSHAYRSPKLMWLIHEKYTNSQAGAGSW